MKRTLLTLLTLGHLVRAGREHGLSKRIRFTADGKVSVNDTAGRSEGTWKLSGTTIVLTLGGAPVMGHLEPDGRLKFDRLLDVYSDDPDECSA